MGNIRCAAKPAAQARNRELEATEAEIWSRAITCIYETDPEVVFGAATKD
jgi:hypothetical protein